MALDSSSPDWADQVLEATDGKGVDLIVDQVSGGVMNDNLKATQILGRIVNVGRLGGFKGELDFDLHALRRIDYIGVTFRTRSEEEVAEIIDAMKADLWGAVEVGRVVDPNRQGVSLGASRRSASIHERQPALWQDLTDGLNVARDGAGRAQQSVVPGLSVLR